METLNSYYQNTENLAASYAMFVQHNFMSFVAFSKVVFISHCLSSVNHLHKLVRLVIHCHSSLQYVL